MIRKSENLSLKSKRVADSELSNLRKSVQLKPRDSAEVVRSDIKNIKLVKKIIIIVR
jgi:hypothetical protein